MIVGIYADVWDHTAFVHNIVILPLTFVGGVFYSRGRAALAVARALATLNPIFYLRADAIRCGFLGTSDVAIGIALLAGRDRGHSS